MFNTKKTVRQDIHENEVAYSGTVTAVTHKTIGVFIPALDIDVDVQRNPDASVQNGSVPEVGDIATVHIVRLYYTAFDILEKGEIITHRDKEREELLAIRNGKYLREDGSYAPEFFEFVDALEKRFQDDVRKTPLPAKPDFGKIEELLVEINKSYLRRIV